MSDRTITDAYGHVWTITGRWCRVCGMPLHRLIPSHETAHITCVNNPQENP